MKKFIALFTAMLFVVSAFAFVGCGGGERPTPLDVSTMSNEELLVYSVTGGLTKGSVLGLSTPSTESPIRDQKLSMELVINELSMAGTNVFGDDSFGIELDADFDADTNAFDTDMELDLFGESPAISAIYCQEGIYITDLMELTDDVLGISMDEISALMGDYGLTGDPYADYEDTYVDYDYDFTYEDDSLYDEDYTYDEELWDDTVTPDYGYSSPVGALEGLDYEALIATLTELEPAITKAITDAVDKHLTQGVTKEIKDITVEGVEYKNAYNVKFSIDGKTAFNIILDVATALCKEDALAEYLPEGFDISTLPTDEILPVMEGINLSFDNLVSAEGDTVVLDIDVTAAGKKFAVDFYDVDKKAEMKAGFLKEDGSFDEAMGVLYYTYTLDGKNEKGVIGFNEDGVETELIKFEGSFDGDAHEGTLSIISAVTTSLDYLVKGDTYNGKFEISNIKVSDGEETESLDIKFGIEYDIYTESADLDLYLKGDIQGTKIDMSASLEYEYANVTIIIPKDYKSFDEISEMEILSWANKLSEEYPGIFEGLMNMGGPSYEDDYDYNEDFDYDYGYDEDFDYDYDFDEDYSIDFGDLEYDF